MSEMVIKVGKLYQLTSMVHVFKIPEDGTYQEIINLMSSPIEWSWSRALPKGAIILPWIVKPINVRGHYKGCTIPMLAFLWYEKNFVTLLRHYHPPDRFFQELKT